MLTAAIDAQPLYMSIILGVLLVLLAWFAFGLILGPIIGRSIHDQKRADAQAAADFDEPTRDQIEAGWLNEDETFGPADDAEWNAILDVIGLTHEDVIAAYRRSQQAQRMDRIREDIQVRRFREQIETWGGGAA